MSPESAAGEALADAVLAGGEKARVATRVMLNYLCPDDRDPCEREQGAGVGWAAGGVGVL